MSSKPTFLFIFGTRPEVIKCAPLVHAVKTSRQFDAVVCTTSQHRDMQDSMMQLFGLEADYDLDVMKPGQDLYYLTSILIEKIKPVLDEVKPSAVFVQGDTTTCFAGALAAFYAGVPVGHLEAGLRTYRLDAPFPEEGNRQLTSRIATWHFAPTQQAKQHLIDEGISPDAIYVTGNTVIDALFWMCERLDAGTCHAALDTPIQALVDAKKPYVLITGHRRENFGEGFENICRSIGRLAAEYPEMAFVYPVHLNPNVREPVNRLLDDADNIFLCEPLNYVNFVALMRGAYLILTDSGGVQEEGPSFGKPVLVMRDTSERPEGVHAGVARLVGTDIERIVSAVSSLIDDPEAYQKMARSTNPYGDGKASEKILDVMTVAHLG